MRNLITMRHSGAGVAGLTARTACQNPCVYPCPWFEKRGLEARSSSPKRLLDGSWDMSLIVVSSIRPAIAIAKWLPTLPNSRVSVPPRRFASSGQGEAGRIEPPFRLGMRGCKQACNFSKKI